MTIKIRQLTPAQFAQVQEYVFYWKDYFFAAEPADRPRAEAGMRKVYEKAGFNPPKEIIWRSSPDEVLELIVRLGDDKGRNISEDIDYNTLEEAKDTVKEKISGQVQNQIWSQLKPNMFTTWSLVFDQRVEGQHNSLGYCYYKFINDVLGVDCSLLEGHWELVQSAGWWWTFENIAFITERPVEIHLDDKNRFHNETGMAVVYPDRRGIYALNGRRAKLEDLVTNSEKEKKMDQKTLDKILELQQDYYNEDYYGDPADLSGQDLRGLDFRGEFREINMMDASLQKMNCDNANLKNVHFEDVDMEGSSFKNANFQGAEFDDMAMNNCDFRGANFQDADLGCLDMAGSEFRGATFPNAILRCDLDWSYVKVAGADFTGARFFGGANGEDPTLPAQLTPDKVKPFKERYTYGVIVLDGKIPDQEEDDNGGGSPPDSEVNSPSAEKNTAQTCRSTDLTRFSFLACFP